MLKRTSAYSPVTAGRCEGRPRVGMRSATAESGGATSSSDRLSASAASNAATTAAATISTPPNRSGRPRELPPQAPTEPYLRLSPHTALHVPCQSTSLPEPLAHPISGWPKSHFEHVSPFAPFPLQKLHHYYELIRPCPPHWYFRFHGSATYTFSLGIDRQVLKFRALAKVRVTPPPHRTPRGQ